MFELLGRTEALDEFAARVASNLGFDVKPLAHWHATTDSRPYELSETDKLWMRTHSLAVLGRMVACPSAGAALPALHAGVTAGDSSEARTRPSSVPR